MPPRWWSGSSVETADEDEEDRLIDLFDESVVYPAATEMIFYPALRHLRCTVPPMRVEGVRLSYDPSVNAAYVYLGGGEAATSVTLGECPEAEDVEALHSIVLDFDRDGRLIGVEALAARQTLNPRILPTD